MVSDGDCGWSASNPTSCTVPEVALSEYPSPFPPIDYYRQLGVGERLAEKLFSAPPWDAGCPTPGGKVEMVVCTYCPN